MKQWHFFEKVYRRWIVVFTGEKDEFQEEMRLAGYKYYKEIQDSNGMCISLCPDNNDIGQDAYVIWLKDTSDKTLVHEIAHLVMMIFDDLLIPISRENTEAFAHYTEYWYTIIKKTRRQMPNGNTPKDAKTK